MKVKIRFDLSKILLRSIMNLVTDILLHGHYFFFVKYRLPEGSRKKSFFF